MRKEIAALYHRQWAIMAAFDELNTIRTTSHTDSTSLQALLTALRMYPVSKAVKPGNRNYYNTVADHCVNVADHLLQLCLLEQAPAHAIHTVNEVLSIALGHIQTAITRYAGSN